MKKWHDKQVKADILQNEGVLDKITLSSCGGVGTKPHQLLGPRSKISPMEEN